MTPSLAYPLNNLFLLKALKTGDAPEFIILATRVPLITTDLVIYKDKNYVDKSQTGES